MRKARPIRARRSGQQGYALVLVVFLLALAVIATATVAPNILVNGRREKEEEMIWRGKQYVRGIRQFVRYNQMHGGVTKFPTSMDDLVKNKVGIRFMRQAYKDPVNTKDGTWRFIYVGPNGQLIGSLKSHPLGTGTGTQGSGGFGSIFGNNSQPGAGGAAGQGSSFGNSSFGNSSTGNSSFGNSAFNNGGVNSQANGNTVVASPAGQDAAAGTATDAQNGGDAAGDQMSTPQAIQTADVTTDIVGGNIIGVGSKVNQKSIIWYDKAKNYRQFEFIWDPSKEPVNGGANAGVVGIPGQVPQNGSNSVFGGAGGANGFGQQQPGGTMTGNPGPGQTGSPDQPPGVPAPAPQGPTPQQ
jgi:hypothetical protein